MPLLTWQVMFQQNPDFLDTHYSNLALQKSSIMVSDLTDTLFDKYRTLILNESGISLSQDKKELVRTRLIGRLKETGLDSYKKYYEFVTQPESSHEMIHLLDAISTNLTSFFREQAHFDFLNSKLIPELLIKKQKEGSRRIRIWSAAASTGEEPYSLILTMLEHVDSLAWDIKLLATDINTKVLARAREGVYPEERLKSVPQPLLNKYFQKGKTANSGFGKVKDSVRKLVAFRRLNLMETPYPFSGPFDFIFCRNVMIYFTKETQGKLINIFHSHLEKGGFLFIGHSESLTGIKHPFSYVRPTVYCKR